MYHVSVRAKTFLYLHQKVDNLTIHNWDNGSMDIGNIHMDTECKDTQIRWASLAASLVEPVVEMAVEMKMKVEVGPVLGSVVHAVDRSVEIKQDQIRYFVSLCLDSAPASSVKLCKIIYVLDVKGPN